MKKNKGKKHKHQWQILTYQKPFLTSTLNMKGFGKLVCALCLIKKNFIEEENKLKIFFPKLVRK